MVSLLSWPCSSLCRNWAIPHIIGFILCSPFLLVANRRFNINHLYRIHIYFHMIAHFFFYLMISVLSGLSRMVGINSQVCRHLIVNFSFFWQPLCIYKFDFMGSDSRVSGSTSFAKELLVHEAPYHHWSCRSTTLETMLD